MKLLRHALCAAFLLTPAAGCAREPEPPVLPPERRHDWLSFPDGSWVRYRLTRTQAGRTATFEETWTIAERSPEAFVLRVARRLDGEPQEPYTQAIAVPEDASAPDPVGAEGITVGDRTFTCSVREWAQEEGGRRVWESAQFPAWPLREERDLPEGGREETRLVELFSAVRVGDREIVCQVFETRRSGPEAQMVRIREWRSQEVPGHIVRQEVAWGDEAGTSQRVIDFSAEK